MRFSWLALSNVALFSLFFVQACGSSSNPAPDAKPDVARGETADANLDRAAVDVSGDRANSLDVPADSPAKDGDLDAAVDGPPIDTRGPDVAADGRFADAGTPDGRPDSGSKETGTADVNTPDLGIADGSSRDTGAGDGSGVTLDSCFANLPAAEGMQLLATKRNSGGTVRIRILLDTGDRAGLGYAWGLIRFAAEIDGRVTCITEKTQLSYTPSRHNCTDKATASAGNLRFELVSPSVSGTQLTIFESATQTRTETLTDVSCSATGRTSCPPNGPC